jgi:endoglucanase
MSQPSFRDAAYVGKRKKTQTRREVILEGMERAALRKALLKYELAEDLRKQARHISRRRWLSTTASLAAVALATGASAVVCSGWPLWRAYVERFMQADGRVIDDQHETRYTTSEGQAYTLFFALVANERERFEVLLDWTKRHLADGDLEARLPGWRWGRDDDGRWRLLDANAAADADLWLAHTLFEAAALWREPRFHRLAAGLAERIAQLETVDVPGVGRTVLPGPSGFRLPAGVLRLNPSYLVLPQLRGLARHHPAGPWEQMAQSLPEVLRRSAPQGVVPDWVAYDSRSGWHAGEKSPSVGSYDAIRAYLWAGMVARDDPLRSAVLRATRGLLPRLVGGVPPQRVRTDGPALQGEGPPGFSAALLPWLDALGRPDLLRRQQARLLAFSADGACDGPAVEPAGLIGSPPTYYDQVLSLFGTGALAGRFRFDRESRLFTRWTT